jgi:hypothetical protein
MCVECTGEGVVLIEPAGDRATAEDAAAAPAPGPRPRTTPPTPPPGRAAPGAVVPVDEADAPLGAVDPFDEIDPSLERLDEL